MKVVVSLMVVFGGLVFLGWAFEYRVNLTPSMPIGLYQKVAVGEVNHGDYVAVCLPLDVVQVGIERGYLMRGSCSGDAMPVIKQVIAVPGYRVVVGLEFLGVGQDKFFAPRQSYDHAHYRLQSWIVLGVQNNTDSYWLYGFYSPRYSWDSRYFGGVKRENILGVYREVLVLHDDGPDDSLSSGEPSTQSSSKKSTKPA